MITGQVLQERLPPHLKECESEQEIVMREIFMFLANNELFFHIYPELKTDATLKDKMFEYENMFDSNHLKEGKSIKLEGKTLYPCFMQEKTGAKTKA